jgi:hypothetical protein
MNVFREPLLCSLIIDFRVPERAILIELEERVVSYLYILHILMLFGVI